MRVLVAEDERLMADAIAESASGGAPWPWTSATTGTLRWNGSWCTATTS